MEREGERKKERHHDSYFDIESILLNSCANLLDVLVNEEEQLLTCLHQRLVLIQASQFDEFENIEFTTKQKRCDES
jgi:hypothetical protein